MIPPIKHYAKCLCEVLVKHGEHNDSEIKINRKQAKIELAYVVFIEGIGSMTTSNLINIS